MTDAIESLKDGLKIDQENGGVRTNDQENDGIGTNDQKNGEIGTNDQENDRIGKDLKKGSSQFLQNLPEELRAVYDDLSSQAKIYFNAIKNNEDKTNYLTSTLANQKKQRSKGVLAVNFLIAVVVLLMTLGVIIAKVCHYFLFGIGMGVMTGYDAKLTLAISLFGPGVVFADWIKDLQKD